MSDERRRILDMLEAGKVSADEAERLLSALGESDDSTGGRSPAVRSKYLRVVVEPGGEGQGERVNVRVPLALIRAGMKFEALLPEHARSHLRQTFSEKGLNIDVSKLSAESLDEFLAALQEFRTDIEGKNGERIRVFCE